MMTNHIIFKGQRLKIGFDEKKDYKFKDQIKKNCQTKPHVPKSLVGMIILFLPRKFNYRKKWIQKAPHDV